MFMEREDTWSEISVRATGLQFSDLLFFQAEFVIDPFHESTDGLGRHAESVMRNSA